MNKSIVCVFLILVAFAVSSTGQDWTKDFEVSGKIWPIAIASAPRLSPEAAKEFTRKLRERTTLLRAAADTPPISLGVAPSPAVTKPTFELDLPALLDRHLKTFLHYRLSGRNVWFSGAFDAQKKTYVSVLVDGFLPVYFDVLALLNSDRRLNFGGFQYTLSLSPNIFNKMQSTLNFVNGANSREAARFTIQQLFDAISAAGLPIKVSGQDYRFYYASGVGGERMFVFICGQDRDFQNFLIQEKLVPEGNIGVFALIGGKRIGLSRRGAKLQIFDRL